MARPALKPQSIELLPQVESLVRSGQLKEAQTALQDLVKSKIPRQIIASVASLARRADLPLIALKLLYPLVRPTSKAPATAIPLEKMEYAASLIKIGALDEGLVLLRDLPTSDPKRDLFTAFGLIGKWDYEGSIPYLIKFLHREKKDAYLKMVAGVNLASAYVFAREYQKAKTTLDVLLTQTRTNKMQLLYANCLDLAAENSIFHGKWEAAEDYLQRASSVLQSGDRFEFFIRKWRAVLALRKSPQDPAAQDTLKKIAEEASKRQLWESVRDCRRVLALSQHDAGELLHLYVGSPFEPFRTILKKEMGEKFTPPERYEWCHGSKKSSLYLDLLEGQERKSRAKLKVGQIVHRTLLILCSDFYRPFRLPTLFASLYPNEYYNPNSSPLRVHQALNRLKGWLSKHRIPLRVEEMEGTYRISFHAGGTILIPTGSSTSKVDILKRHFQGTVFTLKEASRVLNVSSSNALRILNSGIEQKVLQRSGERRGTNYRFH